MKKIVFAVFCSLLVSVAFAQDTIAPSVPAVKKLNLQKHAGDHFMIQLSSDHLAGMPDSISSHQQGFSRGFNAYFMFNKPFKGSPRISLGIGVGISTSNIMFKRMDVGLTAGTSTLPFTALDSANHFKKYKLAVSYLEIPLEFRYTAKPDKPNKSLKAAIGLKLGTLANVHTKGKTLVTKDNQTINSYTQKENSKNYINGSHFMATARVGYGILSLFGSYQLNNILKDGAGPQMKLFQVGLTLSGL
jgi:hypothetical protein